MKRLTISAVAVLFLMTFASGWAMAGPARALQVLRFQTMVGVEGPFVGDANAIRGIPGDELPWEIAAARGQLSADGKLLLFVRGLVFTNDPSVPPELRGKNDETEFRAVVSCLAPDGHGGVSTVNVTTGGFPATPSGNSIIDTRIDLPDPCIAPIIFVIAGSEDKWFAVTGVESADAN